MKMSTIVFVCIIGLLLTLSVIMFTDASEAREQLVAKEQERLALEQRIPVVERTTREKVEATFQSVLDENDHLAAELAKLREVVPNVQVKEVTRWKTEQVEVPIVLEVPVEAGEEIPLTMEIDGVSARLETIEGAQFALGTVTINKLSPPPPQTFTVPFTSDQLNVIIEQPRVERDRWLFGPGGGFINGQEVAGVAIITRPWRPTLFRREVEVRGVGVLAAGEGEWTAFAALTMGL